MGKSKKKNTITITLSERQALIIDTALDALMEEVERSPLERLLNSDLGKCRGNGGPCGEISDISDLLEWHTS